MITTPAYYGGWCETVGSVRPTSGAGPAVQLALSIKNIPTGPGDALNIQGVYTNGATLYNIQDYLAGSAGANTICSGTGLPGRLPER